MQVGGGGWDWWWWWVALVVSAVVVDGWGQLGVVVVVGDSGGTW